MPEYLVDFSYRIRDYSTIEVIAEDVEEAKKFALEDILEETPDVDDVQIEDVVELPSNG